MPRLAMTLAAAGVTGLVLGWLGADVVLVGSGWSLLPWALAGLAVGAVVRPTRRSVAAGACYGFVLAFSFMAIGYDGSASLVSRTPFFVVLGLVGAACGAALAVAAAAVTPARRQETGPRR